MKKVKKKYLYFVFYSWQGGIANSAIELNKKIESIEDIQEVSQKVNIGNYKDLVIQNWILLK